MLESSNEYERRWEWSINLLSTVALAESGTSAYVIWGTEPADTGDHNDPTTWSQLKLDETFDPSTEAAQLYLRDFCGRFFEEDFALHPSPNFECAINRFDRWLKEQSNSTNPDSAYVDACASAIGLPVSPDVFHDCLVSWSYEMGENTILSYSGVVKIIYFPFKSSIRFDDPNSVLEKEWNLIEQWMDNDVKYVAPTEVSKHFFSSATFWWFDTNKNGSLPNLIIDGNKVYKVDRVAAWKANRPGTWANLTCLLNC